jgi:protein involved in polysaccharide export with SLBB domain
MKMPNAMRSWNRTAARASWALWLVLAVAAVAQAQDSDPLGLNKALGLQGTTPTTATPVTPTPTTSQIPSTTPAPAQPTQAADYAANQRSNVFGAQLFTGAFAGPGAGTFNPDYAIAVGDSIQVRFWGAFQYQDLLAVDAKGNIFLPNVGPVQVLGVHNKDLQHVVEAAARQVFRSNVYSYASLAAAQPVRVFVSGFVNRPGLYNGTSMDSLLHYLDLAGGIDVDRGSFLNVQVKRGGTLRASANLYDFLLDGSLPLVQLADGDTIFVGQRQNTVVVSGMAENAKVFEFSDARRTVADVIKMAKPLASATHVRVTRSAGAVANTEYYALSEAAAVPLQNGDALEFTADKKQGTITVRVQGEHQSPQEYVLPYGTRLGELMKRVELTERSEPKDLQLFRVSVKARQQQMLQTSLQSLANTVLTARSGTAEEAQLRTQEAALIMQWVERAKAVQPSGQVFIASSRNRDDLLLENGDMLNVPARDGLVLVNGEVLFPNAVAFDSKMGVEDYIRRAGGYTQGADSERVIVAHRDGSFDQNEGLGVQLFDDGGPTAQVRPGDQILVLPKVDVKSRQIAKELTQILYQIAISAKVVTGL